MKRHNEGETKGVRDSLDPVDQGLVRYLVIEGAHLSHRAVETERLERVREREVREKRREWGRVGRDRPTAAEKRACKATESLIPSPSQYFGQDR